MTPMMRVRMHRCGTCIFRVEYPQATSDRIFGDVARLDSYVACHKYLSDDDDSDDDGVADANAGSVMCRGWYDREPYQNLNMRLAAMLRRDVFVDAEGNAVACPIPQGDGRWEGGAMNET
jgi:hypothetical protein